MKTTDRLALYACFALLSSAGTIACGSDDESEDPGQMIATSEGKGLFLYVDPYAPDNAGMPNPITTAATASAQAFDVDGKLRIKLTVTGFPATRPFGSHLHKLDCTDPMKAGGHYQNMPFPVGGMANDPVYANTTNEAWLDFTTDASGDAETDLTVNWIPREGEAKAIIFHNMTSGVGGASGPKLGCLPIDGF